MKLLQYGCSIIGLIISIIIVAYTDKLKKEKCLCTDDWRREYVKIFAIITIILTIGICAKNIFMPGKMILSKMISKIVYVVLTLYMIAAVVNIFALFTYTQKIECSSQCISCRKNQNWMSSFLYYYSMVIAVLYFIVIVFSIALGVLMKTNPTLMANIKTIATKRK